MRKISLLAIITIIVGIYFFFPHKVSAAIWCGGDGVAPTQRPLITAITSGPRVGEVTVRFSSVSGANRYFLLYGLTSSTYIYGAPDIGGAQATSYTIKSLVPGTRYFLKVGVANNCTLGPYSIEVNAWAAHN